jgi:hypothetical protein
MAAKNQNSVRWNIFSTEIELNLLFSDLKKIEFRMETTRLKNFKKIRHFGFLKKCYFYKSFTFKDLLWLKNMI